MAKHSSIYYTHRSKKPQMIDQKIKEVLAKNLPQDKVVAEIKKIMNYKDPAADIEYLEIVKEEEVKPRLKEYIETGGSPGYFVGYESLDAELTDNRIGYTMKLGSCTDWGGFPTMGKTTFLNQLLINVSRFYGLRHIMFVPDAGSVEEVYGELIWTFSGTPTNARFRGCMSVEKAHSIYDELKKNFVVIDKLGAASYEEVLRSVHKISKEFGQGYFHTVVVDSWKDLKKKYERGETTTDYLARMLSRRNAMSKFLNVHSHTVIHPSKPQEGDMSKPPGSYDYMGGSEWYNNAKSQMTCHRDKSQPIDYENPINNVMEIHSLKQKPKVVGVEGVTNRLRYSVRENRYYELSSDGSGLELPRKREDVVIPKFTVNERHWSDDYYNNKDVEAPF